MVALTSSSARAALGVKPNATIDEIRRAYRKQALRAHPDKGGDPEAFGRIRRAFELLSRPVIGIPSLKAAGSATGRGARTVASAVRRDSRGTVGPPKKRARSASGGSAAARDSAKGQQYIPLRSLFRKKKQQRETEAQKEAGERSDVQPNDASRSIKQPAKLRRNSSNFMEEWRERARLAAEMVGFVPSSSSTVPNLARGGGRDTGMSGSRGGSDEPDVERVREVDGSRGLSREAFRLFFREYKERATSKERAALLNSLPVAVRCQFQVILDKLERHRSGRRDKGNKEERSIRHREKNNKKNNNKDNQEKETNQKKVASKDKAQQTMKKYFDGLRALPRVMRHRAFAKLPAHVRAALVPARCLAVATQSSDTAGANGCHVVAKDSTSGDFEQQSRSHPVVAAGTVADTRPGVAGDDSGSGSPDREALVALAARVRAVSGQQRMTLLKALPMATRRALEQHVVAERQRAASEVGTSKLRPCVVVSASPAGTSPRPAGR